LWVWFGWLQSSLSLVYTVNLGFANPKHVMKGRALQRQFASQLTKVMNVMPGAMMLIGFAIMEVGLLQDQRVLVPLA